MCHARRNPPRPDSRIELRSHVHANGARSLLKWAINAVGFSTYLAAELAAPMQALDILDYLMAKTTCEQPRNYAKAQGPIDHV